MNDVSNRLGDTTILCYFVCRLFDVILSHIRKVELGYLFCEDTIDMYFAISQNNDITKIEL